MGRCLLCLVLVISSAPSSASVCGNAGQAELARGKVYNDLDRNQKRDTGEPGVPGVSVSNGCEVVRSGQDGGYEINLQAGQILFVSQPSGWSVPVNKHQQPLFYYLHYPEGSTPDRGSDPIAWRWPVIEPTGPLPDPIDFALLQLPEARNGFRAHAFADTQAASDLSQDMLREELVDTLLDNPFGVELSITVGDVAYDNLGLYPRHIEMMGLIGVPNWNLPGNHDINFESPNATLANETYKRYFGPTYYSLDQGKVHFVALNNVEYAGSGGNDSFSNGRYRGHISEDQLYWLERDLEHVTKDRLVVIATHIPLLTDAPSGGNRPAEGIRSDVINTVNFDRLLQLLEPFENVYGIAGHDTSNSWKQQIDHRHGWRGNPWIAHTLAEVRGNGWTRGPRDTRGVRDAMMQDGNPNGFYVLHFEGTSVVPEFIPFPSGPDAEKRMRITLDPLPQGEGETLLRGVLAPGTSVVANLFDGGERDVLYLSLDGGPEVLMTHTLRTDPTFERAYDRYLETEDDFGSPAVSSHIWEYELPSGLDPGVHTLRVRSVDEFGQERRGTATFEVTEPTKHR